MTDHARRPHPPIPASGARDPRHAARSILIEVTT